MNLRIDCTSACRASGRRAPHSVLTLQDAAVAASGDYRRRATALMALGANAGAILAKKSGIDALFLSRDDAVGVQSLAIGRLFSGKTLANARVVRE